jgi:phosphoglycolate phosphatase
MILSGAEPLTSRPAALLFDLDGTLVDSRRDIADACNASLEALALQPLAFEEILPMIGDGARALLVRAIAAALARPGAQARGAEARGARSAERAEDFFRGVGGSAPDRDGQDATVEAAFAAFKVRYLARPCVHTVLLPGAREILEDARRARIACALVTNKPRDVTDALLAALGVRSAFAGVWGGGDGPLKPAPDGVLAMLARLGVSAGQAWMIGDGPQDIGAGKAAGCRTIGVPGIAERERLLASAPDALCESLDEVRALLRSVTADPA